MKLLQVLSLVFFTAAVSNAQIQVIPLGRALNASNSGGSAGFPCNGITACPGSTLARNGSTTNVRVSGALGGAYALFAATSATACPIIMPITGQPLLSAPAVIRTGTMNLGSLLGGCPGSDAFSIPLPPVPVFLQAAAVTPSGTPAFTPVVQV